MFFIRVLEALEKNKVRYAVVGGLAVTLHGAVRGTVDLDLILNINKNNFLNAEKSLISIGLQSRLPVTATDVFQYRLEYIKNRNLIAWSYYNPQKPSEVVDIIITHDLSKLKTKTLSLYSQKISVLDIEDLIQMKKESGRPQDLEDIKALQSLKGSKS